MFWFQFQRQGKQGAMQQLPPAAAGNQPSENISLPVLVEGTIGG